MLKVKVLSTVLALTVSIGVLAGCSSSKSGDDKQANSSSKTSSSTETSNSSALKDGVYKVEYDQYDSRDYKGQLELTVSGGKITAVAYDEAKKDGTFKSKDEAYKTAMQASKNTYPEKVYTTLEDEVVAKQSGDVDVVAGATSSSNSFIALAKYAVETMAAKGDITPATIPAK